MGDLLKGTGKANDAMRLPGLPMSTKSSDDTSRPLVDHERIGESLSTILMLDTDDLAELDLDGFGQNVAELSDSENDRIKADLILLLGEAEPDRDNEVDALDAPDDIEDELSLYLSQMGSSDLLSPEEEVALSRTIQDGKRAEKKLMQENDLTDDEIEAYEHMLEEGKQARKHFIEANTRLVVSEAKRYRGSGLSFMDLIQAGNVGLIKAVDKFDHTMGNKFSTYAVWWIRQTIRRTLTRQGHSIRLPSYLRQRMVKFHRTAQRLEKKTGRQPTPEEVADELGVENVRRLRRLLLVGQHTLSLNTPVDGKEGEGELAYYIEDKDSPSPQQLVQKHMLKEEIKAVMEEVLTSKELMVIKQRFGLGGWQPHTLQALADRLGVSRERVRQIEKRALRKLRHPYSSHKLRAYVP